MPVDIFRDTWVRYLGYANEVGEAFRAVAPRSWVLGSYKVAFFYVLGDTITKSWNTFKNTSSPIRVLITAGDVMIWQTLASIVIPGLVINRICAYTNIALNRHGKMIPYRLRSGITVVVGLASIPIIIHPIDVGTTMFVDNTYRRYF